MEEDTHQPNELNSQMRVMKTHLKARYSYSDMNSSSGSELSELAIHALLVETRARNLDGEVYQDPDSDRYLIPGERVVSIG